MKWDNTKISFIFCFLLCLCLANTIYAQQDSDTDDAVVYKLGTVYVTTERLSEYVKNHPQNVVQIDRNEIIKRNFLEVGEVLDSMPGVDVTQSQGSMGARISIRGGGGSGSVLVLIDGRPINSAQYGGVNLGSIPLEIVKSITVFKPPVPVWLGPGGAAGVVNIVTKGSSGRNSEKKENYARVKINGGSYGTANISAAYMVHQDQGKVLFTTGAGHKDGKRSNSDSDSGNASFNWQTEGQSGIRYDLNGKYYHSYHGSPGPTDNPTPDARQRYQKGAMDFHVNNIRDDTREYKVKTYLDIEDLNDESQSGVRSTLDARKAGISGETIWTPENGFCALRLGGLVETNRVDHNLSGDHHREKVSLHIQHDQEFNNFTASLGVRGDHTNDFGEFPAFTAGLSYALGANTTVKTNAGYSVETPSFNQLYQPSHGSIDQVRGNPDLDEEKIYSFDLGMEHKIRKDTIFNASLFRTNTSDLIIYQRGNDHIYRPVNISRAYKQGVELALKSELTKNISTDLSYIYQDTKNKETGGELSQAPHHNFKITGKFVLPTKTKIETIFKAVSSQYSSPDTPQEQKLDSYAVVNLKVIHPLALMSWPCEVFVHVDNLFDTDYEHHAGYPDDGFRFLAGMNINF
ncbi:MAG: TonB-dependent receptor [Proteobacteria bacterium]|nr:TonB-dependent receptor [Pseudomonadota bacterium]